MHFEVRTDTRPAERFVQFVFAEQMPFATAKALNDTAKDFQKAQRSRLDRIFTLRQKLFAERAIKIKPFASKDSLEARISVDAPGGKSDVFAKFETDTVKDPLDGSVAVPTEHVPRTASGIVRKNWRPKRVLDRTFQEPFRAFLAKRGNGRRAIWFDEGDRIVPLYWLVDRVPIEPDLKFVETANKTVDERFQANFTRAFDLATRTAR